MALTKIKKEQISSVDPATLSSAVAVNKGGTGATDAGSARTNLGLAIGTNVQAHAGDLDTLSSMQTGAATALAALTSNELQILDDATVSTTELNFVSGVSSSIQDQLDGKLSLTGGTMSGAIAMGNSKITGLGTPTAGTDAANKSYVDNFVNGLTWKSSVKVASKSNVSLTSHGNIDGDTISNGDRVLLLGQSNDYENGIYVSDGTDLSRAEDMNAAGEFSGSAVFVEGGTSEDVGYVCTNDGDVTIGTTSITFVQFTGAGQLVGGNGIDITGNTVSADLATNGGLQISSNKLAVKAQGIVYVDSSQGDVTATPYVNAGIPGSGGSSTNLTGGSGNVAVLEFDDTDFTGANAGNGTSITNNGNYVLVFLNGVLLAGMTSVGTPTADDVDGLDNLDYDYILRAPNYGAPTPETSSDTKIYFKSGTVSNDDIITTIGFR